MRYPKSTPRLAFGRKFGVPAQPELHSGTNVTVRLGAKWLQYWIKAGEQPFGVVLLDSEGQPIGTATVAQVLYCRLQEVPDNVLRLEHDFDCTNWRGLFDRMREVYGEAVRPDSYVTVVFFRRDEEEV